MSTTGNPPRGGKSRTPLRVRPHPRTARFSVNGRMVSRLLALLTIDAGGVLLSRNDHMGRALPVERYHESPLIDWAVRCVRLLILFFGARQLFILKNEIAPGQGESTRRTLRARGFFKYSGLIDRDDHYLITQTPEAKGLWCLEHGVDFHVDNSDAVGAHLPDFTTFVRFQENLADKEAHLRSVANRTIQGNLNTLIVGDWP